MTPETLKNQLQQVTENLSTANENLKIDEYLDTAKGLLEQVKERSGISLTELRDQIDELSTVTDKFTSNEKAKAVREAITAIHSQLEGLRSKVGEGAEKSGIIGIIGGFFGGGFEKFGKLFDNWSNKIAFSAGKMLDKVEGTKAGQESFWMKVLSFFVSKERKALAQALKRKGFAGIDVKKGGRIDGLIGIFHEKYAARDSKDEGRALQKFFALVAKEARNGNSAKMISYEDLEKAAEKVTMPTTPAPKPTPTPTPKPPAETAPSA